MARLEFVQFQPWSPALAGESDVVWQPDSQRRIADLPQIYRADGSGWAEANQWALSRAAHYRAKPKTVLSLMRHLKAYADFLEEANIDWRRFPVRLDERVLVRFRGRLVDDIRTGAIASSTARSRMSAVIQFYRFAETQQLIAPEAPMWSERTVVIPFIDNVGFKRTMARAVTDLSIPNRARPGIALEDGLLPLSSDAMTSLLSFVGREESDELHLQLSLGFFTGARLGTITTLRRETLDTARPDPLTPGFYLMPVGPGTGVSTKFDVNGDLMVPDFILRDLRAYAGSEERLRRQAKAASENKSVLFLTRLSNPYCVNSTDRLVQELRKKAVEAGLQFMKGFKFHQTRATYGTWMMQILLGVVKVNVAIDIVRQAMFHKDEATTLRYVKFLETTKGKQEVAAAFNAAFTGLRARDWNALDA